MQQIRTPALISRAAIAVGVALCATPIFTSAQSNDATRMFNEMQAMRQEIAELRDMIERQQFELRKLKRAQQAASSRPTTPVYGNTANTQYGTQIPAPQTSGAPTNTVSVQEQPIAGVNNPIPSATSASGNESLYGGLAGEVPSSTPNTAPIQQGVPVSSAVITAPPVQTQDTGYPPVVERSVTGTPNGNAPVTTQYPRSATPTSGDEYAVRQIQQAVPRSAIDAANQDVAPTVQAPVVASSTGTGVIAVPNAVPNSNQAPNTAVQQTAPAQVAGVNNVGGGQTVAAALPSTQPAIAPAAPVLSETDFYQQGFNLLKQSKHADAVSVFERQIAAYPQGDYADDAYYWIAESMYVNRNLDVSKRNFKAIIDNYKQSTRLPDAMLKTAYIEQEQGNQIEARILLQEIVQFHPRSNAAISAKNRLAEMVN